LFAVCTIRSVRLLLDQIPPNLFLTGGMTFKAVYSARFETFPCKGAFHRIACVAVLFSNSISWHRRCMFGAVVWLLPSGANVTG